MPAKFARTMLTLGAVAQLSIAVPIATPAAAAQSWDSRRDDDRGRWDRDRRRGDSNRREWERERRKDAKADGIVAGVVGTAVLAGIIAAAASSNKKDRRRDDRAEYCRDRYGNYDRDRDAYRAADGRYYACE